MKKIKGLKINESTYNLENGKKGKVAVFIYAGSHDPRPIIDSAIRIYVDGNNYYEFIDSQLNCPWMKVVFSNLNDIKQEKFTDYMFKLNRKRKLEKLNKLNGIKNY